MNSGESKRNHLAATMSTAEQDRIRWNVAGSSPWDPPLFQSQLPSTEQQPHQDQQRPDDGAQGLSSERPPASRDWPSTMDQQPLEYQRLPHDDTRGSPSSEPVDEERILPFAEPMRQVEEYNIQPWQVGISDEDLLASQEWLQSVQGQQFSQQQQQQRPPPPSDIDQNSTSALDEDEARSLCLRSSINCAARSTAVWTTDSTLVFIPKTVPVHLRESLMSVITETVERRPLNPAPLRQEHDINRTEASIPPPAPKPCPKDLKEYMARLEESAERLLRNPRFIRQHEIDFVNGPCFAIE